MARVGTRVYSTDCTVVSRYTLFNYKVYTRTLMVFVTLTLTLHITQSLLFECLLNVFGNTVTNHSRCTRHSGVRMHSSQ